MLHCEMQKVFYLQQVFNDLLGHLFHDSKIGLKNDLDKFPNEFDFDVVLFQNKLFLH